MKQDLRLFHELLRHMPDAIYFKDQNSCFLAASDFTAQILGAKDADALLGKSDFDFFSADQAEVMFQDEQKIMATGQPILWKEEHEIMGDGREKWFSTTKVPLHDENGAVIGVLGISRDQTTDKLAALRVEKQDRELRAHLGRVEAEIERARVVQEMLLPGVPPSSRGMSIRTRHRPMEVVGGDYWAFPNLGGAGQGILLGDLTGHGVSAALYMTLVQFVCEQLWDECGNHTCRLLAELNNALKKQMSGCFLTAVYAIFRAESAGLSVRLAGAGHPLPLILRADGSTEFVELESTGALALFSEFSAKESRASLNVGDSMVLYTDGLTEVWNANEELFGEEGLAKAASELRDCSPDALADGLLAAADAFRGDESPTDDTVVIVIRAEGYR